MSCANCMHVLFSMKTQLALWIQLITASSPLFGFFRLAPFRLLKPQFFMRLGRRLKRLLDAAHEPIFGSWFVLYVFWFLRCWHRVYRSLNRS